MRNRYNEELRQLHGLLVEMGNLCQEAIFMAAHLLKEENPSTDEVAAKEREIDQKEREIEGLCMHLILLQQPIATDLRRISSALKMITDMERIGDQALDIADLSLYIAGSMNEGKTQKDLWKMAEMTVQMVTDSVTAFVNNDYDLALKAMHSDDAVDKLFETVKADIVEMIRDEKTGATNALDFLMVAKYFERIGDHAENIAEWVEFTITGAHESKN